MTFRLILVSVSALAIACSPPDDGGEGEGEGEGFTADPVCTDATAVPCRDQQFQELGMADDANTRAVTDTDRGSGVHEVFVDASAGPARDEGWVYGKFDLDAGEFVKADVADDPSFDSLDWDLGFRRYVIRANGGIGGPSCVGIANLGDGDAFEDIEDIPGDTEFQLEEYYDDQCDLTPDGSGLDTSPGTLTQNYWKYTAEFCLSMTQNVYLVQLASGNIVKLEVFQYYADGEQAICDAGGTVDTDTAGEIGFRWKQLL